VIFLADIGAQTLEMHRNPAGFLVKPGFLRDLAKDYATFGGFGRWT
jgi:hypothetical protein